MASSRLCTGNTAVTGPKVSSRITVISGRTSRRTVGAYQ
jgi:hypothetical protein